MKRKINIENDILVGLHRERDIGQLLQNDRNKISSSEANSKKHKADLKRKNLTASGNRSSKTLKKVN